MEETKRRIDSIIVQGLLITSNDTGTDVNQIYANHKLETLVAVPLKEYILEGFGPEIKHWFDSNEGNLETCTQVIAAGDFVYLCKDCHRHDLCCICEFCFRDSEHTNHRYEVMKAGFSGYICNCGEKDLWRDHSNCTRHKKFEKSEKGIPEAFLTKFGCIIKYLCELLEKICTADPLVFDRYMETMVETYIRSVDSQPSQKDDKKSIKKDITKLSPANASKSCLIVLNDGLHPFESYINCFMSLLHRSLEDSKTHTEEIEKFGFTCVQYLTDSSKCKKTQVMIEKCPHLIISGQVIKCAVVKVYRLYFMKIAAILIDVVNKYCCKKTKLCDLLSEVIFRQTSLVHVYVVNEHFLWKNLRFELINGLFLTATFSEIGKRYLTTLFLGNISGLYSCFLDDHHKKCDCFLSLTTRFTTHSHLVMYLVENGFLSKSLDVFSDLLKSVGIKAGVDVTQLDIQSISARTKLKRVLNTKESLTECLRVSLKEYEWSAKFRSQLSEAGKRLVQFCSDFDNIQPLQIVRGPRIDQAWYQYLLSLVGAIHEVLCRLVKWLVFYDDVATVTLKAFLERFAQDIKRILNDKPHVPIHQKIVMHCNVETDRFSIFNLSNRVFSDILMDCCLKGTMPSEIKDKVLGDEVMLMWISRPAVTAISFAANYLSSEYSEDLKHLDLLIGIYFKSNLRHYLYMQDFNIIQVLISHLDPDLFLKYLLFNIAPSIRKQVSLSESLSSILRLHEFDVGFNVHQLHVLVYNALVERHFVGVFEKPEYQWLERQVVHSLACGHSNFHEIQKTIFVYREIYATDVRSLNQTLDDILEKVSFSVESQADDEESNIRLKPEYFNIVNMFYFMYYYPEGVDVTKTLTYLYNTNRCKFQLPDIVKLRELFEGINNFLYSEAFSDLNMHILGEWYKNLGPSATGAADNLLLASMSLCFMLKASLYQRIDSRFQKTTELIFGIRKDLGDKNVMTLLVFLKNKLVHDIFGSIVNHLMELSQIPKNYFDDLGEKPSDMINKSKDCKDLALKNLQAKYQEISRNNEDLDSVIKGISQL
ncbi:E3 ubiquitin-protein ligase UBR1 [Thelohanellus kitauei]|uniref:E3 ubiquitin-protein ligase n=1 Tax=Thelohanellus kitauei TaxID=669202 RepID=A0A0C2JRX6_THEKT|nr:E3 ubiquitin-protein ligase UBR1 [Thelohanellus kitauei]